VPFGGHATRQAHAERGATSITRGYGYRPAVSQHDLRYDVQSQAKPWGLVFIYDMTSHRLENAELSARRDSCSPIMNLHHDFAAIVPSEEANRLGLPTMQNGVPKQVREHLRDTVAIPFTVKVTLPRGVVPSLRTRGQWTLNVRHTRASA